MIIWFLVVLVLNPVDLTSSLVQLSVSDNYRYNDFKTCQEAGDEITNALKAKAPPNAAVLYTCQPMDFNDIMKALPPPV